MVRTALDALRALGHAQALVDILRESSSEAVVTMMCVRSLAGVQWGQADTATLDVAQGAATVLSDLVFCKRFRDPSFVRIVSNAIAKVASALHPSREFSSCILFCSEALLTLLRESRNSEVSGICSALTTICLQHPGHRSIVLSGLQRDGAQSAASLLQEIATSSFSHGSPAEVLCLFGACAGVGAVTKEMATFPLCRSMQVAGLKAIPCLIDDRDASAIAPTEITSAAAAAFAAATQLKDDVEVLCLASAVLVTTLDVQDMLHDDVGGHCGLSIGHEMLTCCLEVAGLAASKAASSSRDKRLVLLREAARMTTIAINASELDAGKKVLEACSKTLGIALAAGLAVEFQSQKGGCDTLLEGAASQVLVALWHLVGPSSIEEALCRWGRDCASLTCAGASAVT